MTTYFKAITEDGFDFYTRTVDYGKAVKARSKAGTTVGHPKPKTGSEDARDYISVATVPTDCTGFAWPARLLEVEPVGEVWTPHPDSMPNKRAVEGFWVIRELPAWRLFGLEGQRIVAIIDARAALTSSQKEDLYAEYRKTSDEFWRVYSSVVSDGRAGRAGLRAARVALDGRLDGWDDVRAAYGAALALLCRPLVGTAFTQDEYDTLSRPWRSVMGEIHPDDRVMK